MSTQSRTDADVWRVELLLAPGRNSSRTTHRLSLGTARSALGRRTVGGQVVVAAAARSCPAGGHGFGMANESGPAYLESRVIRSAAQFHPDSVSFQRRIPEYNPGRGMRSFGRHNMLLNLSVTSLACASAAPAG